MKLLDNITKVSREEAIKRLCDACELLEHIGPWINGEADYMYCGFCQAGSYDVAVRIEHKPNCKWVALTDLP